MMASVSGILILTVAPSPGPAENIDHAADLLDVGLHHVHADAAAGNVGHGLRGRESGLEDQVQRLAIAQLLRLFGPQKPFLDGLLFDPRDVNPRPVIADFDVDLPAFVIGAKSQSSLRRLARARLGLRALRCRGRTNCGPGGPAGP